MMRQERLSSNLDWVTIGLYLLLVFFGWTMILAVDYKGDSLNLFDFTTSHGKQLIWIGVALVLGFAMLVIDHKFYPATAYGFYGLMIILLVATLLLAPEVKGAKSWFPIGPFTFQPSEFAKTATALVLARYLTELSANMKQFRTRLMSLFLIMLPTILIVIQGDTGSALVFLGLFIVLFREGFPVTLPLIGLLLGALFLLTVRYGAIPVLIGISVIYVATMVLMALNFKYNQMRMLLASVVFLLCTSYTYFGVDYVFNDVLQEHQQTRINVLLGKEFSAGADYNVQQSKIAISSGGFSGKGYLQGTLNKGEFVPEQNTDFIFSTMGEELGFIGTGVFILLFILFLLRIIYLAERQRSRFTTIFGYGVVSILFVHFIINVGMTIGILPVVGIPLPFMSYGGSSLMGFTMLIFVLLKLDASRKMVFR